MQLVVNDRELELAGQATIKDLLRHLEVTVRHVAVEVNGELIRRAEHESHQLQAGDRVEVVTLVGGG
ncbi:MAG: sulfur carrier protein ThiS [Pirellulaceae bacterium]